MDDSPVVLRLINIKRRLRDLLMAKELSLDPERTGVVELADFGKRCEKLAEFAQKSADEVPDLAPIADDLWLAARLAALMETLPRSPERVRKQVELLKEVAAAAEIARQSGGEIHDEPVLLSLSTLARQERELFEPFFAFAGKLRESPPGFGRRAELRRGLRRALLDHDPDSGPFELDVGENGMMRYAGTAVAVEAIGDELERSSSEPPEVARVLDMREGTDDDALRDFLLVKAVDEALFAVLQPRLATPGLAEQARALPTRPGKGHTVRPESVRRDVAGWDQGAAARLAEKLAARRLGPDAARLPKGAYVLRLFVSESDALAADLFWLATALRRMEKGEAVEDAQPRAMRALNGLMGLLR